MPEIKMQHVCSFSSEDPNHRADNVLSSETFRKWTCAAPGEKQASVVVQLEKATQIHSVDIGNNGSAFVEVLVCRSTKPEDYQVLLVTSSFMSPGESKGWSNSGRVRIFGREKLSKPAVEEKWDRIKVVCSQPFNKTEKYGLSFIKLHSPPKASDEDGGPSATSPAQPIKLGSFSLKDDPKDLPSGSLFFHREHETAPVVPEASTATKARMASTVALKSDLSKSPRAAAKSSRADSRVVKSSPSGDATAAKRGASSSGLKRAAKQGTDEEVPSAKRRKIASAVESDARGGTGIGQILKGVVFSISGFKNPFRGELRSKATEMGAVYEPDWGPACTHLLCAFPNTPKFNQVKAKKGLIVKKDWVLDCHVKKRRLPAKKYRLSSGSGGSGSEDELYDKREAAIFGKLATKAESHTPLATPPHPHLPALPPAAETSSVGSGDTLPLAEEEEEEEDPYGGSTDEDEEMDTRGVQGKQDLSDPDTEDEIQRVHDSHKDSDPYASSTEEERGDEVRAKPGSVVSQQTKPTRSLTDLPDLFSKYHFLFYGNLSAADRRLITRYIVAYAGCIEDYMNDKVTHVLTQEDWDDNFDQALADNSGLVFVRPKWLFACHEAQACVPQRPFLVAPS